MMILNNGCTTASLRDIPVLPDKRISYPKPKPPGPNDYLIPIPPRKPRD
ncbi:MAG: hypothetical protein V1757_08545 [Actinomycetota bacterium]